MKISRLIASFALIIGGCLFAQSHAGAVTINGLGFTTAQDTNPAPSNDGTHFHSDSGGSFGNPAGLLEVGTYFVNPLHIEEIRGHGEFNLASIPAGAATLSFDVFGLGGLFSQANFVETWVLHCRILFLVGHYVTTLRVVHRMRIADCAA